MIEATSAAASIVKQFKIAHESCFIRTFKMFQCSQSDVMAGLLACQLFDGSVTHFKAHLEIAQRSQRAH